MRWGEARTVGATLLVLVSLAGQASAQGGLHPSEKQQIIDSVRRLLVAKESWYGAANTEQHVSLERYEAREVARALKDQVLRGLERAGPPRGSAPTSRPGSSPAPPRAGSCPGA